MAEHHIPQPENHDPKKDSNEQKMMWIFSGAIVLLILGAMGANMMFHKEAPPAADTEISAQSRTSK
jgi:hypothetical protein